MLNEINTDYEHCIFIDNLDKNLQFPKSLGACVIKYTNMNILRSQLDTVLLDLQSSP